MANMVLEKIVNSAEKTPAGFPTMPGYTPGAQSAAGAFGGAQATQVAKQSGFTPAGSAPAGAYGAQVPAPVPGAVQYSDAARLTMDDVVVKTGFLTGLMIAAAFASAALMTLQPQAASLLLLAATVVGLVTGLVNVFRREPSPVLISIYAAAEGVVMGALAAILESTLPGVVGQAALATFAVFVVALVAYRFGWVKNGRRLQAFALIGVISVLLLQVANGLLTFFGVFSNPYGIEGMSFMGIPVAALLGLLVILIGTASLIGDFDAAARAVNVGVEKKYAWSLAFGIMVTVIWLYFNLLRYAMILASDR